MAITTALRKRVKQKDEEMMLFPGTSDATQETLVSADEGRLAVDVFETERELIIKSAIAGVRTEHLEVFVHNDMLTLRGQRKEEVEPGAVPLVRECHWGSFSRSIILPTEIDADHISAALKDGVLTVRLPKVERSRKISVKAM